jgi:hypothetical protein
MRIGLLEAHQAVSDTPHLITGKKAHRLVHELRVAIHLTPTLIRLTVKKSWSVVKGWLAVTAEQRQKAEERELAYADWVKQMRAQSTFPNGAEYGFAQWPAKDQRSQCGYSS